MNESNFNRRQLLARAVIGALTAVCAPEAQAVSQKLDPADPTAKNVGYVLNAAQVDIKKYPTYVKGQTCDNCSLIQLRYGPLRPCTLFPGKLVTATGWCNAWAKRSFGK